MIKLTGITNPVFINPLYVIAVKTSDSPYDGQYVTLIYLVNGTETIVKETADEVIAMMNGQWR